MTQKEIKTLEDLEALQPRERDVWFAEQFGFIGDGVHTFTITDYGISELKTEMVKLGYNYHINYEGENEPRAAYDVEFLHPDGDTPRFEYVYYADNEIEATWKAAALALLGE